jgi:predicted  nucleic acid-binding Zn-ribbon protein
VSWICERCGTRYPDSDGERGDGCLSCTKIVPEDADVLQEDLTEQLRIQNGILLELVYQRRRANAIFQGKPPEEAPDDNLAKYVEDNVLDLEERVDLDAVERVAETP